jgi:glycosyltransferase involved in cell wall biosynthesis
LVTVVIPTFNRADLLLRAIASVVGQTYRHWELVIVDDGSTDDTAERIKDLGDSRIRYAEIEHSGLLGKVRNAGVAVGRGGVGGGRE